MDVGADDDAVVAEQVEYYRAVAGQYDDGRLAEPGEEELAAAFEVFAPRGDVLELACGPGTWTTRLLRHATTVTAVDASPEMQALARERVLGDADRVRFVEADLFSWRPDRRYDVVFMGFWISHVPRGRFADFWSRVQEALVPGGRVMFVDDAHRTPEELIEGEASSTIGRRLRDGTTHRLVKVPHTPEGLERELATLGWGIRVHRTAGPFYWGAGGRAEPRGERGVELERANIARMYDYWLGGAQNFAVDRVQAERIAAANPDVVAVARANRAFLARAVTWCLDEGIDQFLDLGSGVPTVGNVHEVAQARRPDARVAYVDVEPVAVARAHDLLAAIPTATVTRADLRDAAAVLDAPGVAGLLDVTRPIALLAVAVLHYVPDDLVGVLAPYLARLAPGSALVVSHVSDDQDDPELVARLHAATEAFRDTTTAVTLRSRAELHAVLDPLTLVAPGLVELDDWPTADPGRRVTGFYCAVATVPGASGVSPRDRREAR